MPAAWAGRWVANPFAGAEWIEVRHSRDGGGPQRVYQIKDAKKVADVVKAAKIIGIRNDMFAGCIPTAEFIVHRRDGTTFRASFAGTDGCLSCDTGTFALDEGFFTALERAVSDNSDEPVNLGKFLPAAPGTFVKPAPPPDAKSLAGGFTSLTVTYLLGDQLHVTRIADEKTLDALGKVLVVLKTESITKERAESRNMTVTCKDGADFYLQIPGRDVVFDFHVGRFTLRPPSLTPSTRRSAGGPASTSTSPPIRTPSPMGLQTPGEEVPRPARQRPGIAAHREARRQGGDHRHRRSERGRATGRPAPPG